MLTYKLKRILRRDFGKVPDPTYFHGDMEHIRDYYDYRRRTEDGYLVDDITWTDLDMDRVFRRINTGLSSSGEQYLYYTLRSPAQTEAEYKKRRSLLEFMESDPERRLSLQVVLARLGRTRQADLSAAFAPSEHGYFRLVVFLILALLVPASLAAAFIIGQGAFVAPFAAVFLNIIVHENGKRGRERDYGTVNYSVAMIFAMNRIRKLKIPEIDRLMAPAYESLDRLRVILRTGGVFSAPAGAAGDMLSTVLLLDLISYEFLKNRLGRHHRDVFAVHENLGRLDAAIAVASYRKSLASYAEPELDFSADRPYMDARAMTHPLLSSVVPNDLVSDRPILITGSNASGKSTYLKTAALTAIMAQTLCTCLAGGYRASAFRIYSSMALGDDLLAGESYYIVETRSLKRILDAAEGDVPVLCVIDEVLRGTNTVERIAASAEVLSALGDGGVLCLAATHDIELCSLLADRYTLCHFEEQVGETEMTFDYLVRPGKATSRNAINILKLIGFGDDIVDGAHRRADRYVKTGMWEK